MPRASRRRRNVAGVTRVSSITEYPITAPTGPLRQGNSLWLVHLCSPAQLRLPALHCVGANAPGDTSCKPLIHLVFPIHRRFRFRHGRRSAPALPQCPPIDHDIRCASPSKILSRQGVHLHFDYPGHAPCRRPVPQRRARPGDATTDCAAMMLDVVVTAGHTRADPHRAVFSEVLP